MITKDILRKAKALKTNTLLSEKMFTKMEMLLDKIKWDIVRSQRNSSKRR